MTAVGLNWSNDQDEWKEQIQSQSEGDKKKKKRQQKKPKKLFNNFVILFI